MKLSALYEAKAKSADKSYNNPKQSGAQEGEAEGKSSKTVKKHPAFGATLGPYRGPFSS